MEARVVTTDGTDPRVRDRPVARALEDRPVLVVVTEARFVFDTGEPGQPVRQREPIDVVGDLLREAAGHREAGGRRVEGPGGGGRTALGHDRAGVAQRPRQADSRRDATAGRLPAWPRLEAI